MKTNATYVYSTVTHAFEAMPKKQIHVIRISGSPHQLFLSIYFFVISLICQVNHCSSRFKRLSGEDVVTGVFLTPPVLWFVYYRAKGSAFPLLVRSYLNENLSTATAVPTRCAVFLVTTLPPCSFRRASTCAPPSHEYCI